MIRFSAALLNESGVEEFLEIVRAVDDDPGYENLFVSDERFYKNTYALLALAARNSERVGLGTGVTNPYTRNPAFTAAAIATVDEISDGRAFLGLGAGSPMVLDPIGVEQDDPVGAVRTATRTIRKLLDGEAVTVEHDAFELDDVRLDFEPERRVPVYVAGRGPQLLSLGGHVGDGVVAGAGLTSVEGMEYAMERVAVGADHGDRDADDLDVVCWAFLSIAEDRADALDAVTPITARIVQAVPMPALEAIGVDRADAERVKELGDVDDLSAAELRDGVPEPVVEQFAIAGTPAHCREHVRNLTRAGVSHVSVLPFENSENDALGNFEMFSSEVIEVLDDD